MLSKCLGFIKYLEEKRNLPILAKIEKEINKFSAGGS